MQPSDLTIQDFHTNSTAQALLLKALAVMPVLLIVRGEYGEVLPSVLPILKQHEIGLLEITMNSPHALRTIGQLQVVS